MLLCRTASKKEGQECDRINRQRLMDIIAQTHIASLGVNSRSHSQIAASARFSVWLRKSETVT